MWRLQSYDSSTDEEEEVEGGGSHIPGLVDRRSTFLLGTTTRFDIVKTLNLRPFQLSLILLSTVNPLLSPPGELIFLSTLEGVGGGGLFNLAKRITCSKNAVVSDSEDLPVVQLKSLSKVFNSLVGA